MITIGYSASASNCVAFGSPVSRPLAAGNLMGRESFPHRSAHLLDSHLACLVPYSLSLVSGPVSLSPSTGGTVPHLHSRVKGNSGKNFP